MKVFICTDHDDHYPVGVASVVIENTKSKAKKLLDTALMDRGLKPFSQKPYTFKEIDLTIPSAYILQDGNY